MKVKALSLAWTSFNPLNEVHSFETLGVPQKVLETQYVSILLMRCIRLRLRGS
ncbi:hypothetical protein SAMN05444955_106147 [Lihuaxuella thermophila]|uniref:Uncharacterized protein n=1 Tax=Lihuaxuella thermophila TaxID=1173111 RepID=A0A1H8E5G4_9BACL|nr:hypothetical protein SAMN05444955_106147 [Lihuaxuella thermophila]